MKMKGLKKILLSLSMGVMLTLSTISSASAATATGIIAPVEEESTQLPQIESSQENADAATYLATPSGIRQTAASISSISLQWNKVTNATRYRISLKLYNSSDEFRNLGEVSSTSAKISTLSAGTAYTIKIEARNNTETSSSYLINCTTLYAKANIKSSYATSKGYTFNTQAPKLSGSISGYKVVYKNLRTNATKTKYYKGYSFTIPTEKNTFYLVKIYPYLILNNQRFIHTSKPTAQYIAMEVTPQKAANTNNSMTVKWNRVTGASSYSVYVKYPGSDSYRKVITTQNNTYKLTGMKLNTNYYMKIVATKKAGNKIWKSYPKAYRLTLITKS